MKEIKNTKPKSSLLLLCLVIGFILGILVARYLLFTPDQAQKESPYKYINPILTSGKTKLCL